MNKEDLARLWELPWFDRRLRSYYNLDPRRHLRWNLHERTIYYIVRRSAPRGSQPGRFPIDEKTLRWLLRCERNGWVDDTRVVLVEDWTAPPQVVNYGTAHWIWDRVQHIVPLSSTDYNTYWWIDDNGEPQDAWLGPVLTKPPF